MPDLCDKHELGTVQVDAAVEVSESDVEGGVVLGRYSPPTVRNRTIYGPFDSLTHLVCCRYRLYMLIAMTFSMW